MPGRTKTMIALGLLLATRAGAESLPETPSAAWQTEEIVVTAAKTTSALEVVTDPRLPRQPVPAHDGADYLKTIPGFSIIRKGGTDGDPVFRGMAASRVGIVADGGTVHGGCGMRMDPPTAYLFPQSYDRIRVLKGPQTVLWGPGSSAATVIFERDPYDADTDSNELYVSAMASSWGRHDLAVDGQLGSTYGYLRLQGSDSRSANYNDGDGNEVHSKYQRWNGHLSVGWTPRPGTLLELSVAASDGEAAYADRMMDGSRFKREHYGLRLQQDLQIGMIRRVEASLSLNDIDHVMDNYSLRRFAPGMMMPTPSASNPDRRTFNGRVVATLEPARHSEVEVGMDIERNRHRNRSTRNQLTMPFEDLSRERDARFSQVGLFGEWTLQPDPAQTWISGLRLDYWTVRDDRDSVATSMGMGQPNPTAGASDHQLLPSAFLRYEHNLAPGRASAETLVFVGLGHAQRVADYWERIGNGRQSSDTISAFYTDAEKTTQLDWGLIHETETLRASASLFYNEIRDFILIDTIYPGKAGAGVTRNIQARSWGGELELSRRFSEHWQADAALAYTRGENRSDGTPLGQMPPLEARLGITWRRDSWSLGGLLRLVDSQDRVDPGRGNIVGQDIGKTSGYAIVSLNGSHDFSEQVQLSFGVDNLFDRSYAEHLSRAGAMVPGFVTSERVNEPGRLLWARMAWTWRQV